MIDRKFNLIIPVLDEDDTLLKIYVPQPAKASYDSISRALGYFYKIATKDIPIDVIVIDYKQYIEEAIENYPRKDDFINTFNAFLDRTLSSSYVFDGKDFKAWPEVTLSDEVRNNAEGMLVFICALLRYVSPTNRNKLIKDYYTSQDYMEWKNSLTKSSNAYKEKRVKVSATESLK